MVEVIEQTLWEQNICCEMDKWSHYRDCGNAVYYCYADNGELWVGNSEYGTQVNFCPFCGKEAERKREE